MASGPESATPTEGLAAYYRDDMEKRFALFLVLSTLVLFVHLALTSPPKRPAGQADKGAQAKGAAAQDAQAGQDAQKPERQLGQQPPEQAKQPGQPGAGQQDPAQRGEDVGVLPEPDPGLPSRWVTLGSADPDGPYRMLVTLTSQGAAVLRIELSSPRYHDLEDRSGYLGHVVVEEGIVGGGCPVQVVGDGTPAAMAGLRAGDLIRAIDGNPISGSHALREALSRTKPGQTIALDVLRGGEELTLYATLRRRPLEIIRPEGHDPLSFRLTLQRLDEHTAVEPQKVVEVGEEIAGLNLWSSNWELVSASKTEAVFRRRLPKSGLELTKTYRLAEVPAEKLADATYPAYHLELEVAIRNCGTVARKVAYQLDGPTGLPTEGWWYATKVSRASGQAGLRDFVVNWGHGEPAMVNCPAIAEGGSSARKWPEDEANLLAYVGIDTQYFAVMVLPKRQQREIRFAQVNPLLVGPVDKNYKTLANTSCRMVSVPMELAPEQSVLHSFTIYAGPKKPRLLAHYGLQEVVYYGLGIFALFAKPLVQVLHVLYAIAPNWGIAIILLTVLVRGCMFPLSRKQALSALKMQELQPELKKIQEKYKNNLEARTKAQQELFKKHNYHPLRGCLVIFIQLPIFIGLYRALMVDVELRQAPLISESVRWCSNLAAPDMLFDWTWLLPQMLTHGTSWYVLGPYFNLLPVLTVALFIWQQKILMPPPADEQAAMQMKIMRYMMVFMGLLFFKVASGLCIYFIASSLWGMGERLVLPKPRPPSGEEPPQTRADAKAREKALQQQTKRDLAERKKKAGKH